MPFPHRRGNGPGRDQRSRLDQCSNCIESVERNRSRPTQHHGRYGTAAVATAQDVAAALDAVAGRLGPAPGAAARGAQGVVEPSSLMGAGTVVRIPPAPPSFRFSLRSIGRSGRAAGPVGLLQICSSTSRRKPTRRDRGARRRCRTADSKFSCAARGSLPSFRCHDTLREAGTR